MKQRFMYKLLSIVIIGAVSLFAQTNSLGSNKIKVYSQSNEYTLSKKNGTKKINAETKLNGIREALISKTGSIIHANSELLIPLDNTFIEAMPRNDDNYAGPFNLQFTFQLYDIAQTQLYLNNNGNISFGSGYGEYTSTGFPVSGFPMVAPFWADVDTRNIGSGLVYYKSEPHRFTVIWNSVGYYSSMADKLSTFELIITDGTDPIIGIGNNVAFSYADMGWTTGSASNGVNGFGGVPATVGINRGNGTNYKLIGRFDHSGNDYDGPDGIYDGVDYLDNKTFTFYVGQQSGNEAAVNVLVNNSPDLLASEPGNRGLVKLFDQTGFLVDSRSTDASGKASFVNILSGSNYSMEILYSPVIGSAVGREYWGRVSEVSIERNITQNINFIRNLPCISSIQIYNNSTGIEIPVGSSIELGTPLRISVSVKNPSSNGAETRSTRSRLLLTKSIGSVIEYDQTSSPITVSIGSVQKNNFLITPQTVGDYYGLPVCYSAASTNNGSGFVLTDSSSWSETPLFSIGGTASLQVVSPNGGEIWNVGESKIIRWTSSGLSGNVNILLSRDGGSTYSNLFTNVVNTGSITWSNITGPAAQNCFIKIVSVTTPSLSDFSNSAFQIKVLLTSDLAVYDSDISFTQLANNVVKASTVIRNLGSTVSSVGIRFQQLDLITNQFTAVADQTISSFSANSTRTVDQTFTPVSSSVKFHVVVDPNNSIQEVLETNNRASSNVPVTVPEITQIRSEKNRITSMVEVGYFRDKILGQWNTFTATVTGNPDKVEFTIGGTTIIDNTSVDGWSARFDMGSFTGDQILSIKATKGGLSSTLKNVTIRMLPNPIWFQKLSVLDYEVMERDNEYCKIKIPIGSNVGQLIQILNKAIPGNIPLIGGKSIIFKGQIIVTVFVPLDPNKEWKGSIEWKYEGKIFERDFTVFEDQRDASVRGTLTFSRSGELNTVELSGEGNYSLPPLEWYYPPYPLSFFLPPPVSGLGVRFGIGVGIKGSIETNIKLGVINNRWQLKGISVSPGLTPEVFGSATLTTVFPLAELSAILYGQLPINLNASYVNNDGFGNPGWSWDYNGQFVVGAKFVGSVGVRPFQISGTIVNIPTLLGPYNFPSPGQSKVIKDYQSYLLNPVPEPILPTILPYPSVSSSLNGDVLAIAWLSNRGDDTSNAKIYFSSKKHSTEWAEPLIAINDEEHSISLPKVAVKDTQNILLVYVRNMLDKNNPQQLSLDKILNQQEIYFLRWNGLQWNLPTAITSDEAGNEHSDGIPTIAISNAGQSLILWTRNLSENAYDNSHLQIFYSVLSDTSHSSPLSITTSASNFRPQISYLNRGDSAVAIWIHDGDGNLLSISDQSLQYSIWDGSQWGMANDFLSNGNAIKDVSICFTESNNGVISWIEEEYGSDTTIVYHLMSSQWDSIHISWQNREEVYNSKVLIETPHALIDHRNIAVVTWRGTNEGINGDLFGSTKNLNESGSIWSTPRALTSGELVKWMFTSALDANNNLYSIGLENDFTNHSNQQRNFFDGLSIITKGVKKNDGFSDELSIGYRQLLPDIMLQGIGTDSTNVAAGQSINLKTVAENIGDVTSIATTVQYFKGDPENGGTPIGEAINIPPIKPDSSFVAEINWTVDSGKYNIYAIVDPDSITADQSRINNIAVNNMNIIPDVSVSEIILPQENIFPGIVASIRPIISNNGIAPASRVLVQLFASDSIDGAGIQLGSDIIMSSIGINEKDTLRFQYVIRTAPYQYFRCLVDPYNSVAELNDTNNITIDKIKILPDVVIDTCKYVNKQLVVTLRNTGYSIAQNIRVKAYNGFPQNGGSIIDSTMVRELAPFGIDSVIIDWNSDGGRQTIFCTANENGILEELNTNNNSYTNEFYVQGEGDIRVKIITDPQIYALGDTVRVFAKISNTGTRSINNIPVNLIFGKITAVPSETNSIVPYINPSQEIIDTLSIIVADSTAFQFKCSADISSVTGDINYVNNVDSISVRTILHAKEISAQTGWNLISVPYLLNNMNVNSIFSPGNTSAIGFETSYQLSDTLKLGKGYWMKFDVPKTRRVIGSLIQDSTISVSSGWNLIGIPNIPWSVQQIVSQPSGIIQSSFFGYNSGYQIADTLQLGKAYWINTNQLGMLRLSLSTTFLAKTTKQINLKDNHSEFNIVDKNNRIQTLYFISDDVPAMIVGYRLPPKGPAGIFDARFSDDTYAQRADAGPQKVLLTSAEFPIEVFAKGINFKIRDDLDGVLLNRYVRDGERITITNSEIRSFIVEAIVIPKKYQLYQNFPNPFNPKTKIRFDLPENGKTHISLYNVLGQKVYEIVNQEYEAGTYTVDFDARLLASGVYFYKIESGKYSDIKKMLLLK